MNMPARVESPNALTMNEQEVCKVLQTSLYPGAAMESIKMVIGYCKAAGLDPMQKPVHIVPMWDSKAGSMRDVIMPGINLYRTQAARSGECAGVTEPEFGEDITETLGGVEITYPKWCRVTVKRRLPSGEIVEFTAKELWKENYAVKGGKEKSIAPNAMWLKRPSGQIAKCAQAQAFRMAFPEMASAYTAEEMEGKELNAERDITPTATAGDGRPSLDPYPQSRLEENLPGWKELVLKKEKTTAQIISNVEKRATLTAAQKKQIEDLNIVDAEIITAPAAAQEQPQ